MQYTKRPVLVIGCGGHGRVVADIARAAGAAVTGFLDDNPGAARAGLNVTGPVREEADRHLATHRFVVAIGDQGIRRELSELILANGGELATLVHPGAIIAPDVTIGAGTVIMAGAIVNTGSWIGRFAIVNTGSILDHDAVVEDNVHIAPGCALAGKVTCRHDAMIGTGASIIPGIVIGEGAIVAAGATVIRDVRARTLVAGCPAIEKRVL